MKLHSAVGCLIGHITVSVMELTKTEIGWIPSHNFSTVLKNT